MENTGFRFAELRTRHDLKQWQIARILNVKTNTYSKWEKGINDISLEKLNELANFYRVSLDYFVGISDLYYEVKPKPIKLAIMRKRLLLLRQEKNLSQSLLSKKQVLPKQLILVLRQEYELLLLLNFFIFVNFIKFLSIIY